MSSVPSMLYGDRYCSSRVWIGAHHESREKMVFSAYQLPTLRALADRKGSPTSQ